MWVNFANAKATHIFFSKNIYVYAIFNNQSFNDTSTNNIVSFEQLGPDWYFSSMHSKLSRGAHNNHYIGADR